MNVLVTILLMTISQIIGCYQLNSYLSNKGDSLNTDSNTNNKSLFAGLGASVLSGAFAVNHYGAPSGVFIYLGLLSTVGMLFALLGFGRK